MAAINAIANGAWQFLKSTPRMVLGDGHEIISNTLRTAIKGTKNEAGKYVGGNGYRSPKAFWGEVKKAFTAGMEHDATLTAREGGFFKNMWKNLKELPGGFKKEIMTGYRGGSGFFGKLGGAFKGFGKVFMGKMPLIMAIPLILFELPNIIRTIWDEGLIAGMGEMAKASLRLIAGAAFAAIGSALLTPFIGGMLGWFAGDFLMSKIVGKSHTEKKDERKEETQKAVQEAMAANAVAPQGAATPAFASNPFGAVPPMFAAGAAMDQINIAGKYSNDFMSQSLNGTNNAKAAELQKLDLKV